MREYAIFLALNHELADLRREEIRRDFHATGPDLVSLIASVLQSVRAAITEPVDTTPTFTPTLSDYPYRS
jgi:hypothetical protein